MKKWILTATIVCAVSTKAQAMDLTEGLMFAVPVKGGQPPRIDGALEDWDVSRAEPVWTSPETANTMNAEWALMYDDAALYIGVRASLPNRPLLNPNNPQDAFWSGDVLQMRLNSDPALPFPLDNRRDKESDRVSHLTLWKNSETGRDYLHINRGTNLDKGQEANPAGSAISIKMQGTTGYVVEARVPWSALKVPGGTNPFQPGGRMTAILETLWVGGDATRVAAVYRNNPGTFAFFQTSTWGQVEFSATGNLPPRGETLAQILARFAAPTPAAVGVPITVPVPATSKVSVNILGPKGEVLRELIGGEAHPKGQLTLRWDGKDSWGRALPPGNYRWGAYFSGGLKAQFYGAVGKSGTPFYQTSDGKGGWGADHSNPIDCAADESGFYFAWPVSEAGKAIVKTDFEGNVLWRRTPFVGGGWGPFYAIASNGKHVFLTLGDTDLRLVRLDAATGQLLTWNDAGLTELPLGEGKRVEMPSDASPLAVHSAGDEKPNYQPEGVGVAANAREIFVPMYSGNKILVLNAQSGKVERELVCAGPRGVALDPGGNLLAVSYVPGKTAQVVRFAEARGAARAVVTQSLAAPWDVASDRNGRIYVSDLGRAQQIKVFAPDGKLIARRGTPGGRKWMGRYNGNGFLHPAGIAIDPRGGLLVAESAIPKVISRFRAADGKLLDRWFGAPMYWASTWPMPDDPTNIFYPLNDGLGRARIPRQGATGMPEAYFAPRQAGFAHSTDFVDRFHQPEVVRAANGKTYLVSDANPRTIGLLEGDNFRPVAHFRFVAQDAKGNTTGKHTLEIWRDQNGDGQMQPGEVTTLDSVEGKPLAPLAEVTASMHMEPNGDLFFMTHFNRILKIPALGLKPNGALNWDVDEATYAVPLVLPSKSDYMATGWREGLLGARLDGAGNLYTAFNTFLSGGGGPFDFASPEIAAKKRGGMGHSTRFNVVKFAKFDPQGRLLWMAGRGTTGAAKPGEMYHFWNLAGIVNDRYIAGGSEWGQIYFYTHDGFFVDALMNNPGLSPAPGPYTFGGETSGGRVQYFPARDELWAYSTGMAYKVAGFKNGRVQGESRATGTVALDRVYETTTGTQPVAALAPLQIVPLAGDPFVDERVWNTIPTANLKREGAPLATAQLGYDAGFLYGRIRVTDNSPLQNAADTITTAFKGGDTAGVVLGPMGARNQPGAGDVRLMAAMIGGQPRLIAMKTVTRGEKRPQTYFTPAGGNVAFEFVGEVPAGRVILTPDATGYTATFAVPRSFLEFDLQAGQTLAGDIEVRLSGNGQRGLQATSRNYLFTPPSTETTMTDDIPTESRLYPQGWGAVEVK